jgi:hypothetical protein
MLKKYIEELKYIWLKGIFLIKCKIILKLIKKKIYLRPILIF